MTSIFRTPLPAAPKEPTPVRIPAPDDPDLLAARKKSMLDETANRQGRASTVLDKATATGPNYSRTTLG
jgi:hypothetical protein